MIKARRNRRGCFTPAPTSATLKLGKLKVNSTLHKQKQERNQGKDRSVVKRFRETKKRDAIRNVS